MVDQANELHLRWALREIHPLHPDVLRIVLKLQGITDRKVAA
jgi:hypothetical protein